MMDINDLMFQIDEGLQKQGYPAMDAPTLKEVHSRLQPPHVQQMIKSGQINPEMIIKEAIAGLGYLGHKPKGQNKGLLNAGQQAPSEAI